MNDNDRTDARDHDLADQAPDADRNSDIDVDIDIELGRELGRAIDRAVGGEPSRPPVAQIAQRAETMARARRARRTTGTVAASVVLFAGAVIGWNALQDNTPQLDSVSAVESPAQDQPAATTNPSADPGGGAPDAVPPTAAELSTGAVLDWTEVQPNIEPGWDVQPTGDGRLVSITWEEDAERERLLISDNGVDWVPVVLPDIAFVSFDLAGDVWVVTGTPLGAEFGTAYEIYTSDDQGGTWRPLPFDVPRASESRYVTEDLLVGAAASGNGIVVMVQRLTGFDDRQLFSDLGLIDGSQDPEMVAEEVWIADVDNGLVTIEISDELRPVNTRTYSFDELDLTAQEIATLQGDSGQVLELYTEQDGSLELVDSIDGFGEGLVATEAGYFLTLYGAWSLPDQGPILLTSVDGRDWVVGSSAGEFVEGISVSGNRAWVSGADDQGLTIRRSVAGGPWSTVADFSQLQPSQPLQAGPSGLAMVVQPINETFDVPGHVDEGDEIGAADYSGESGELEYLGTFESWVGWSPDGKDWGWQNTADAFGLTRDAGVAVVVGDGFLLATLEDYGQTPYDEGSLEDEPPPGFEEPLSWFVAEVPGS